MSWQHPANLLFRIVSWKLWPRTLCSLQINHSPQTCGNKKYKLLFQRCTKRWPRVWDHSNSYQVSLLVLIGPVLGHFWLPLVFMGHCSSSCNITLSLHSQISQLPYYLCVIQHLPQVLQSFADNSLLVVTSGSLDGPNSINKQPAKTERDKQTERERWAPQLWCELVCWWSFSGRPQ